MALAAAAGAAGQLAGSLIAAKTAKEDRKRKAKKDLVDATFKSGDKVGGAISSIVDNLRATLVK